MRLPLNAHDTPIAALLRFGLELAALFAIGAAFGLYNFAISALALFLFNVKGDKRFVGIQVSGPVRLVIEVAIMLFGIYSTVTAWGLAIGAISAAVWVVYLYLGRERLLWLARGARETPSNDKP